VAPAPLLAGIRAAVVVAPAAVAVAPTLAAPPTQHQALVRALVDLVMAQGPVKALVKA
jgi:hypothetical protein